MFDPQHHESTRLSNAPDIRKSIFGYLASPVRPSGYSSGKIKASVEHCWNDTDRNRTGTQILCRKYLHIESVLHTQQLKALLQRSISLCCFGK